MDIHRRPDKWPGMITFEYQITKDNGAVATFKINLDSETLNLIHEPQTSYPPWTKLEFHQCANCPLDKTKHALCPVARNISSITEVFKQTISTEEVNVEITTEHRSYRKRTAVQHAVSSLVGLIMATSGCPILEKLKPMVRTHLPFANSHETVFRLLSTYLLAQYFVMKRGGTPDWQMLKLEETLKALNLVNSSLVKRLCASKYQDAALNAIARLDCFANMATLNLNGHSVRDLENLFSVYLTKSSSVNTNPE